MVIVVVEVAVTATVIVVVVVVVVPVVVIAAWEGRAKVFFRPFRVLCFGFSGSTSLLKDMPL